MRTELGWVEYLNVRHSIASVGLARILFGMEQEQAKSTETIGNLQKANLLLRAELKTRGNNCDATRLHVLERFAEAYLAWDAWKDNAFAQDQALERVVANWDWHSEFDVTVLAPDYFGKLVGESFTRALSGAIVNGRDMVEDDLNSTLEEVRKVL